MTVSETTVREVRQGEKQYVVPLYQRHYSWERKDDKYPLNQLWDDVLSLDGNDPTSTLGEVVELASLTPGRHVFSRHPDIAARVDVGAPRYCHPPHETNAAVTVAAQDDRAGCAAW